MKIKDTRTFRPYTSDALSCQRYCVGCRREITTDNQPLVAFNTAIGCQTCSGVSGGFHG